MLNFKPETVNGIVIPGHAPLADLKNAIKVPSPEAWAAIRALGSKSEPDAFKILIDLTSSSEWTFRRSAVEAIGDNPHASLASETIINLINDPVGYVARTAMTIAANLNLTCAHKAVLSLIKAPDQTTRLTALSVLDTLWLPTDFDEVINIYLNDKSDQVRKQAARLIHNHLTKEDWQRWATAWSQDPLHEHRVWACQLIAEFGTKTDLPSLWILTGDRDGHVRKAARMAIQHLEGR